MSGICLSVLLSVRVSVGSHTFLVVMQSYVSQATHAFLGFAPIMFHTFLLHALTYWAEILHIILLLCTTNQVFASIFEGVIPLFIRPSSDGTYYGMVMSVRPFSALFSYMLWHNELKFCTWLCFNVLQIKFEYRDFASIFIRPSGRIMVWWCPSVRPGLRPPVFRTFLLHALTYWAEILHMTLF